MFGIGLPEMIVILAIALIVVGPDKLPDMARSAAKWVFELKRTVNQVKESLTEEDSLIGSVHSDLKKTAIDLKDNIVDSDDNFTWHENEHEPGSPTRGMRRPDSGVPNINELTSVNNSSEEDDPAKEKAETENLSQEEQKADLGPDLGEDDQSPPKEPGK